MSNEIRERPILFSAPMVRAILEGRKTQTRRVVKFPRFAAAECVEPLEGCPGEWSWYHEGDRQASIECPYGAPGDRLWVRETFYCDHIDYPTGDVAQMRELLYYRERDLAPCGETYTGFSGETMRNPWCPSIHMPRWASRIDLEIVSVRVERLQGISEADAAAEGIVPLQMDHGDARPRFEGLWDTINGKRAPWASNPWVWVIEFKRITPPVAATDTEGK